MCGVSKENWGQSRHWWRLAARSLQSGGGGGGEKCIRTPWQRKWWTNFGMASNAWHPFWFKKVTDSFCCKENRRTAADINSIIHEMRIDHTGRMKWTDSSVDRMLKNFCSVVDVFFSSRSNHRATGAYWVFKADVFCEKKARHGPAAGQWDRSSMADALGHRWRTC